MRFSSTLSMESQPIFWKSNFELNIRFLQQTLNNWNRFLESRSFIISSITIMIATTKPGIKLFSERSHFLGLARVLTSTGQNIFPRDLRLTYLACRRPWDNPHEMPWALWKTMCAKMIRSQGHTKHKAQTPWASTNQAFLWLRLCLGCPQTMGFPKNMG